MEWPTLLVGATQPQVARLANWQGCFVKRGGLRCNKDVQSSMKEGECMTPCLAIPAVSNGPHGIDSTGSGQAGYGTAQRVTALLS